jgi:hypothetical protein
MMNNRSLVKAYENVEAGNVLWRGTHTAASVAVDDRFCINILRSTLGFSLVEGEKSAPSSRYKCGSVPLACKLKKVSGTQRGSTHVTMHEGETQLRWLLWVCRVDGLHPSNHVGSGVR